jgi:hypothetical protein
LRAKWQLGYIGRELHRPRRNFLCGQSACGGRGPERRRQPVRVQLVPGILDLRGAPSRVIAVLSIPESYSLLDLQITNVRFEGVHALTTVFSSEEQALLAT